MKYVNTPEELAIAYLLTAADEASRRMQEGIRQCGDLSGEKSTQSKKNKEYFEDEARVRAEAVAVINKIRREIAARLNK